MKKKKALIISFSGIGDALLSEVLCENLKMMFSDIQVDIAVKENSAPIFLKNPCINEVISYKNIERKKALLYIKKTWNTMKKKYDIILDVESTPRSELFSFFGLNAEYRAGWNKVSKHKFLWMKIKRGFFYNNKIIRNDSQDVIKNLTKFLDPVINKIDKKDYKKSYDFKINITDEEKNEMKEKMKMIGIDFSKKIIICGVNAVSDAKRWKKEFMFETLKYILDNYNYQLLLFYTPNEKEYTLNLAQELNDKRVFSGIETKDVRDLAKLMVNSDFYFGNEGGARHISQALELPSFAVFSPDAAKKDWLVNNGNTQYDGIEGFDIIGSKVYSMSAAEQYNSITPQTVIEKLKPKLDALR